MTEVRKPRKPAITSECIERLHAIELKVGVLEERSAASKTIQEETQRDVKLILQDVGGLKVKAGIWGGLSGLVPAAIIAIISYIRNNG